MKKRKLFYLICVASLILINALYINYEMIVTLILVLLIPLITWLLYFVVMIGLKVHLYTEHKQIHKSEKIKLKIQVVNACPVPVSRGRLEVFLRYSNEQQLQEQMIIPIPITRGNEKTEPTIFKPVHCGLLKITMGHYLWNDYTGIFQSFRKLNGTMNLVVLPDLLVPDVDMRNKEDSKTVRSKSVSVPDTSEIKDIRLYEPGDAMNRIHWKLSVKEDELMVKEFEQIMPKDNVILVDLSLLNEQDFRDHLDLVYQFIYSYGAHIIRKNRTYDFMVWNNELHLIEEISFSDQTTLDQAIKRIMSIECSHGALKKMIYALEDNEIMTEDHTILVTAQQYNGGQFDVINVSNVDIQKKLDEICG